MKKIIFLTKALIIYLFLYSSGISKELDFLTKGLQHFKKKELDKSKIIIERYCVLAVFRAVTVLCSKAKPPPFVPAVNLPT